MMKPRTFTLALIVCLVAGIAGPSPGAPPRDAKSPIWLVVTRPMFQEAIQPLADHRRKQGMTAIISVEPMEQALKACPATPAFLLLVGDDEPGMQHEPWYVPARRVEQYHWRPGQKTPFASDPAWGDLDGDQTVDIPTGRIPARTASQVAAVVKKILAYENRPADLSDLRLPTWAGSASYSPAVDRIASSMMVASLRQAAPGWSQPWTICSDTSSAFCGWPADHAAIFSRQIAAGGAMVCMIGHGDRDRFCSMWFDGRQIDYTSADAARLLAKGEPAPPALVLACSAGDFTAQEPCLAESFLFAPAGPVAAIAATAESHPLPNYYTGQAFLGGLKNPSPTVGELFLAVQKAAGESRNPLIESLLKDVEGHLNGEVDLARLNRDHQLMYVTLGDPATALKLPLALHGKIKHGPQGTQWSADKPIGATTLWVSFRPDNMTPPAPTDRSDRAKALQAQQQANALFEFPPAMELTLDQPWQGVVQGPGTLRLATRAGGKLYAAGIRLAGPSADRPADVQSGP